MTEEIQNIEGAPEKTSAAPSGKVLPKLPLIISIAALAGVVLLIILHFTGKKNQLAFEGTNNGKTLSVGYVNYDTLMIHYKMVIDMREELEKQKNTLESDVLNKQKILQTKIENYRSNLEANRINLQQAQAAEQQLGAEQQKIMELREIYLNQLAQKQIEMDQVIQDSVINYVHRINKDHHFDYVMGFSKGGGIILANKAFDITQVVIDGLNAEYKK